MATAYGYVLISLANSEENHAVLPALLLDNLYKKYQAKIWVTTIFSTLKTILDKHKTSHQGRASA